MNFCIPFHIQFYLIIWVKVLHANHFQLKKSQISLLVNRTTNNVNIVFDFVNQLHKTDCFFLLHRVISLKGSNSSNYEKLLQIKNSNAQHQN